ncbi:uncharacterized protein N7503_010470 [Penicillium pulvis]|uniref:uncharacterized protein n=1 Tax=Penicillium pulvis TaxID=1562058 RepID=UPI002546D7F5|nr:uncharacterized protein N7503_010470 [Penicillium pulvis]KAJ5785258.1 hypothetical protein N7503_010470 [Penicillium pulvis]
MSDSGTEFRGPHPGYPSSWNRESSWFREEHLPHPRRMVRDPWEGTLESGLADMHEFHLKHHRKELECIGERMRANKPRNSIHQLAEDASQISSYACHLMEEAGKIEFNALQMSNKIHAHASMKTTMKTRADVAGLEANVASLNEAAAKIIKSAAEVCAQVAEMNVNMMRISAEVNDASASKAKEDVSGARETEQQEWRRRNKAKHCESGDCDYWGGVGPWHTNIPKNTATFWLDRPNTTPINHSLWGPSMGSHHRSVDSYEQRRSQNKGMNAASANHGEWDTNTVSYHGSADSYEHRRIQNKGEEVDNDSWV